ncbi:asparagine synthase-related protein [Streptomyces sp. NPDC055815]
MRSPRLAALPFWFVVLPDHPQAERVAAPLRAGAWQTVRHPSGRPWIVGRWAARDAAVVSAGERRLALIGEQAADPARLTEALARLRTVADADALARTWPGSFHLIVAAAGETRVQGTVSGYRRVHRAATDGVTVASDRADVAALLTGTGPDEQRLAVRLLNPPQFHPLIARPVWHGVSCVPHDSYLLLDASGRAREVRWWRPPEPELPLAEGARALREALTAAVAVRTAGRALVSSDLSGLDSTALCALAARTGAAVLACTAGSGDALDDDVRWAATTAAALDRVEHQVVPAERMPGIYQGLDHLAPPLDEPLDEPCGGLADSARWLAVVGPAAERRSPCHLTGYGGDELLTGSPLHLRTLLRRRPAAALRLLRGHAERYRWPRAEMLAQLRPLPPYDRWFAGAADRLGTPPPPEPVPLLDWGPTPRLAPWVTADAADAVRELIRAEAPGARPLAADPGLHDDLDALQEAARPVRLVGLLAARLGLPLAAPYFDDRVVEAALAVRPEDKRPPWAYKPLIQEAMRGIVPDAGLRRPAKSGGLCDLDAALRKNRPALFRLFDGSRLARLGLIDEAALRSLCAGPLAHHPYDLHDGLYQAIACELWLRSREREPERERVPVRSTPNPGAPP